MPRKNSYLTVTDQFCGAGGSSQGAHQLSKQMGGGLEVKLAMNHWKLAIETHSTNFPDTLHDCTDISACDPRRYPSTDILMTSPECTNHSLAKGKKQVKAQLDLYDKQILDPAAERSRATMWDVVRFAEYHKYNLIIVENVVDACKWIMFDDWLRAMHTLGYKHECVYLNSMHCHPTPQSRDRMYVVFWRKGNKAPNLNITPLAFCYKCEKNVNAVQTWKNPLKRFGKYKQQYVYCCSTCAKQVEPYYYAAFNAIDWSDRGQRIGDRNKPLSESTMRRVRYGLEKFGKNPLIISTRYTSGIDCRVKNALSEAIGTQPGDVSHAILSSFYLQLAQTHAGEKRAYAIDDVFKTQTARQDVMLVNPYITYTDQSSANDGLNISDSQKPLRTQTTTQVAGIVVPAYIISRPHGTVEQMRVSSIGDGLPTQIAAHYHGVIQMPVLINQKGKSGERSILDAANTQTSIQHQGLLSHESFSSFIASYYSGSDQVSSPEQALGAVTGKARHLKIEYNPENIKPEDCHYRMLKSHEIGKAMAFDSDYTVLGNERDRVKQYGNAVTPPAMKTLLERAVKTLA